MQKIIITYTARGHRGEKEQMKIEVSFAKDIARDLVKKQKESIFLKRDKYNAFRTWLDSLAMLQGYSRAEFESAEEVTRDEGIM